MNRWGADLKLFKPVGRHFGIYAEARADGDFVSLLRRLVVCPDEQMDLDGGRKLPVEPVRSDVRCKCGPVFGGRHRCDGQGNPIFSQSRRRILCAEDAEGRLQRRILFRSGASSVQDQAPAGLCGSRRRGISRWCTMPKPICITAGTTKPRPTTIARRISSTRRDTTR